MTMSTSTNVVDTVLDMCVNTITQSSKEQLVHIVLTGGTTGKAVTQRLGEVVDQVSSADWDRVHLWWGDERFVPLESGQRNDKGIESILGAAYSPMRVHRAQGSDQCVNVEICARNYRDQLGAFGPTGPKFSLVILGMGPDGHVASLFPYSNQLTATELCVPVTDSPKPPPERITLTFAALNHSLRAVILAAGEEKQPALSRLMSGDVSVDEIPARGISTPVIEILS